MRSLLTTSIATRPETRARPATARRIMRALLASSLAVLAACAAPDTAPDPVSATPLVAPAPVASGVPGTWRDRVRVHAAELAAADPARSSTLRALAPARTRAGTPRFTDPAIHDPRAAAVLLQRLVDGGDPAPVRAALVEALPRTGGLYADAVRELVTAETSPEVRMAMVFSVRRAPAVDALAVIAAGLADRDGEVTAEAARAAAAQPDGARLAPALTTALAAADPSTRAEAARALGVLAISPATGALTALLVDAEAEVRLEALRALDRITPGALAGLPAVRALAADPDPRIARLATRLAAGAAR